jgi:hypothetical protein
VAVLAVVAECFAMISCHDGYRVVQKVLLLMTRMAPPQLKK